MTPEEQLQQIEAQLHELSAQALGLRRYELVKKIIEAIGQVQIDKATDRIDKTLNS